MNTYHSVYVSVVVPVYRSAGTLPQLVERVRSVLGAFGRTYEIVLVDDGSADGTWQAIEGVKKEHGESITGIELMRNFGQHNALMCGFRHCRGRVIVTLDDDLQNPPEEIPKLLEALEATHSDVVYGRYRTKRHARGRNLGSAVVNAFFRTVFRTGVTVTSFRAIRREVVDSILSYSLNFTHVDGLLAWNTRRFGDVLVDHQPRAEGRSGYSLAKLFGLALNLLTNFSVLPLQVASAMGFLASAAGLVVGAFYLAQYFLSNIIVPGYASTIVAVLVLGGLQLLSLGIIGEYVGRLHLNVNRKPQYTVRHTLGVQTPCNSGVACGQPGREGLPTTAQRQGFSDICE